MTAQETYYGIHDDEQLSWIPLQTEKAVDLFVSWKGSNEWQMTVEFDSPDVIYWVDKKKTWGEWKSYDTL